MNTKTKSNIGLAHAVSHFSKNGYQMFLPVGDNGRFIDIIVSQDGKHLERVQCKYTTKRHTASLARNPDSRIWEVDLRQIKTRVVGRPEAVYSKDSFDILFISTPDGDYLIEWQDFCQKHKTVPYTLRLGKKNEHYKLPSS